MATLLIIAHSPLASALKAVAAHIYPEAARELRALDVPPQEPPELTEQRLRALLPGEPTSETLMLTDAFGATPSNAAVKLADGVRTRLVAGVNVPMLWRVLCYRNEPLDVLVQRAVQGATQGVIQGATSRPQNQSAPPTPDDQDPNLHHQ
jgi:mannose PTS system EIIA component